MEEEGLMCGMVHLYTVKICDSNWFNKKLIGQQQERKYRQECQTQKRLGRRRAKRLGKRRAEFEE